MICPDFYGMDVIPGAEPLRCLSLNTLCDGLAHGCKGNSLAEPFDQDSWATCPQMLLDLDGAGVFWTGDERVMGFDSKFRCPDQALHWSYRWPLLQKLLL